MDLIEVVMIAIFVVGFAIMTACVCIAEIVVHPTLRRYGVDRYSRGWRHAGSWIWVLKYREICTQHGLSLRYWNLLQRGRALAIVLTTVWLILFVVQFWRHMVQPLLN